MDKQVIKQIYMVRAQIKELQEREAELKTSLGTLELGEDAVGEFLVRVTPNNRFDAGYAKKALTEKEYESILVQRPDSRIAKARFPEKFEQMQRSYDPKLIITLPDE